MKIRSLHDLFVDHVRDLYNAENQIVKALPKMAKAAEHEELKNAFQEHLEQTRNHADRLEKIFETLGMKAKGKTCKAMEGLLEEGKEIMQEDVEADVMDAALIAAAQKVEHYEIAGYGTARAWALQLGQDQAADLLQQTLDEERQADQKLTAIAEEKSNLEAAHPASTQGE